MSSQGPVALFCAGLAGDGVARNTVHLANALVRRGIPARIVALETGALADQLRPEVRLTLLGRRCGARARALAAALPALRRTLARERPSVLVSMGNHAHLAAWTALRTLPGLPRIYRISNDAGHGGGAVAALRTAAQRLIAADATRLICVSRALAEAAPFRQAARARRVEVLPNGVDVDAVRALAAAPVRHPWLEDGRPFLAALGRVHPQKNYGPLVSALALARQADPSLRLLVLGRTGGAEDGRLAAQVRALGLGDAVRFEGEAANPYPFLARARAYALTSRWEGASNSLLEALACGTPVIASRTAGNAAEVLDGGRHGLLVDPSDHEEIAQAILRQWGDGRLAPGARAEAFALDRVMDRACGIVLAARGEAGRGEAGRGEHDGIQTLAERRGHAASLEPSLRGPTTEY